MITNLAIEGGGVKGIAFVGALMELQSSGLLKNITHVAGTSAGALVATMYALGYNVEQMQQCMHSLNFKRFEEGTNPLRLTTSYGIHTGNYILQFVQELLEKAEKSLHRNSTFQHLQAAGCHLLYVFATDLNTRTTVEFSAEATPDVPVAEAVRASMSIPIYFKAWQFPGAIPNDHIYVDGGLLYNYPLTFFDNARFLALGSDINYNTIGLRFKPGDPVRCRKELSYDHPFHYMRHLIEAMLDTQNIDFSFDSHLVKRSIIIDSLGIAATDFKLSNEDLSNLVESGKRCTKDFLNHMQIKSTGN